jgi:hypothetical protein
MLRRVRYHPVTTISGNASSHAGEHPMASGIFAVDRGCSSGSRRRPARPCAQPPWKVRSVRYTRAVIAAAIVSSGASASASPVSLTTRGIP